MVLGKEKPTSVYWLRGFYLIGDDQSNHSVFSKLIQSEREGKEVLPFTSGKNKYDFIDISLFTERIVSIMSQTKIDGIINVCSGEPVALGERVEAFLREKQFKIKLQYGAYPDRAYDSPAIWGEVQKMNRALSAAKEGNA